MKITNRKIRILVVTTIRATIILWLFINLNAQTQKEESDETIKTLQKFQLVGQIDNAVVKSGEQVLLGLTITNNTETELFLAQSCVTLDYKFTVKDESGEIIPLTKEGERLTNRSKLVCSYKRIKLGSGKSRQAKINLAQIYNMSAKGTYYISASRTAGKPSGERTEAKSDVIQVVVK